LSAANANRWAVHENGEIMEQKQSKLGITSFVIGVIAGIATISGIAIGQESLFFVSLCLASFASLVASVLGIMGLLQKGQKKLFAILGTTLALVIVIFWGYRIIPYFLNGGPL
jgi:hypothetical protein